MTDSQVRIETADTRYAPLRYSPLIDPRNFPNDEAALVDLRLREELRSAQLLLRIVRISDGTVLRDDDYIRQRWPKP